MSTTWEDHIAQINTLFHDDHQETYKESAGKLCEELGGTFLNKPFVVNDANKQAAWELYTELRSRITTQPLRFDHGDEATALQSVHSVFQTLRTAVLRHGPECTDFAHLSMVVLNRIIRPFTAFWHRSLEQKTFERRDMKNRFRRELLALQQDLRYWAVIMGYWAEMPTGKEQPNPQSTYIIPQDLLLQESIPFFSSSDVSPDFLVPDGYKCPNKDMIIKAEQGEIIKRRGVKQATDQQTQAADPQDNADSSPTQTSDDGVKNVVGVAISGGGIRSATFAQGVLQALAHKDMLKDVDYLSTVSGGGYVGSFWSSGGSFKPDPVKSAPDKDPNSSQHTPHQHESASLRHIRNHAKYIQPRGILEWVQIVGSIFYGISLHLLVLIPFVIWSFAAVKYIPSWLPKDTIPCLLKWACISVGVLIIFLPIVQSLCAKEGSFRKGYGNAISIGLIGIGGILVFIGLQILIRPGVSVWFRKWLDWKVLSLLLPSLLILRVMLLFKIPGKLFLRILLFLVACVCYLGLFVSLESIAGAGATSWLWRWILFGSFGILVWLLFFMNVNETSLHKFYRQFLSKTYINRRTEQAVPPKLSELNPETQNAPYHLINTAINLQGSENENLRGRNADFFVFSKHHSGSPITGYVETTTLESLDRHLDLATAMAISGAAAAPNMGTLTQSNLVFLMTLLNIRLGYWFPNPKKLPRFFRFPRLCYLYREFFSRIREDFSYVNLSDGGHIENLGLYELLRRKCKYIIVIDGEADSDMACESLMNLMRYAEIDFGINIRIELNDLKKQDNGFSQMHTVMGLIEYNESETGVLLYIKSSITGDEPLPILDYHRKDSKFPQQSTGDQFFDEEQFEAYRALGEHIGENLFQPEYLGLTGPPASIPQWFDKLANALIPLDWLEQNSRKPVEDRGGS